VKQIVGGTIGAGTGLAVAAAWAFGGGWKHSKRFKALDRAFGDITRNVNALTIEQARETFLKSLATSVVAEARCASTPLRIPACHAEAAALFQRFEQVAAAASNPQQPLSATGGGPCAPVREQPGCGHDRAGVDRARPGLWCTPRRAG